MSAELQRNRPYIVSGQNLKKMHAKRSDPRNYQNFFWKVTFSGQKVTFGVTSELLGGAPRKSLLVTFELLWIFRGSGACSSSHDHNPVFSTSLLNTLKKQQETLRSPANKSTTQQKSCWIELWKRLSKQAHLTGDHWWSGESKVLVFFRVWPFNMHVPYILSADDLDDFSAILAADDFLGACYRKAMTPKKLWTLLFPQMGQEWCDDSPDEEGCVHFQVWDAPVLGGLPLFRANKDPRSQKSEGEKCHKSK